MNQQTSKQLGIPAAFVEEDLKQLAALTKMDFEELKGKYEEVISDGKNYHRVDVNIGTDTITEDRAVGKCHEIPFQIGFFDVLAIRLVLKVCEGACWSATLSGSFIAFGSEITTREWRFDCNSAEVCEEIGLAHALGVKLCFGARGHNLCFYIRGEAWFFWARESFDETIFCLQ